MNGEKIPRTDNHDYLGVTINSKLSWKPHINKVQNKASRTLGLIKRTLHATSRPVRKTAYEALVRPTLEYATCAWCPYTNVDTQKVERVQRAAARFVVGDYQRRSSVTAMLSRLEWDSLEIRRRLRDSSMFYKICNGLVNIPLPPVIVAADNRTRCLHEHKLRVIPSSCLVYQNSYYVRCIPTWNNLPQRAVHADTVTAFQSAALPAIMAM